MDSRGIPYLAKNERDVGHPSFAGRRDLGPYMQNEASADEQSPGSGDLQPGDFYYDGPYLVFTEQYHLRRGTCCDSGCRHCPYRSVSDDLLDYDSGG